MNEFQQIQFRLMAHANDAAKAFSKVAVPGQMKIYGVRMPILNNMAKEFKTGGFTLVKQLWKAGSLEEQILAAKIMERIAKQDAAQALLLVEKFSAGIGNWAVCDAWGMQALKGLVKTHANEIFALAGRLNGSKNLWQRRLSLVLVEWYTRNELMHPQINALVRRVENDEEYYVQKAVAWIKRNLQKGK